MRLKGGETTLRGREGKSRRATEQTLPADNLSQSQLMSHLHSTTGFSAWKNKVSPRSLSRFLTVTHGLSSAVHTCTSRCRSACIPHSLPFKTHFILGFLAAIASRYISDQCMRTYSMFFPGTHTCKALSVGRYGWSWGMRLARWNGRCMI